MSNKFDRNLQVQGRGNEEFQGGKRDLELWNRFEQINRTLSKSIDHLKEYRQIFSKYQLEIVQSTKESVEAISDKVCKLVQHTIQTDIYTKMDSSWTGRFQSSYEKTFSDIVSHLQQIYGQIEETSKQSQNYTPLNINQIRASFENQLAQVNRSLRNVNEDQLISLQYSIDDNFKKFGVLAQKAESYSSSSEIILSKNDQTALNNNQSYKSQGEDSSAQNNNTTPSATAQVTNESNDDNTNLAKKSGTSKDNKNNTNNNNNNNYNNNTDQVGLLNKIKSIFKKDESRPSQVNLEGVSNDFRFCPIKKKWIFEGSEENDVLDEPPPIIPVANQVAGDNMQNNAADSSMSNVGSSTQTLQYESKNGLIKPANYRMGRDAKNKKEVGKTKQRAAVNFMQIPKADESLSNFDSINNNLDGTQQNNLTNNIGSNNAFNSEMNLGIIGNNNNNNNGQDNEYLNMSLIIQNLTSQIKSIIELCTEESVSNIPAIDFEEIEESFNQRTRESGQSVCKELQIEIMKIQKKNAEQLNRMQSSYESQIRVLTRDYMDLMDESFTKEKLKQDTSNDDTLNCTIDNSVMEFCNKQSQKIQQLQTELLKKQCLMGKQDNKNMEIIKNMVEKITELESKILKYADVESENENLILINSQLQNLSKQSQQQAIKIFSIKHQNMQSTTTINHQLAEQIHSRQQLIDTLHTEITQKNRAIHEYQAKNTNLQNISYEKEERIGELQNILEQKELKIKKLNKKESLLNEDVLRLKDLLVAIQNELVSKKTELSQQINDISQLQEKNENYEQLELNMNEELVNLQIEFNIYREETDQSIKQLIQEKQNLDQEKSQTEALLEQINKEKDNLNEEIQSLKQNIQDIEACFEADIAKLDEFIKLLFEDGSEDQESSHFQQPKLAEIVDQLKNKMKEVQNQKEQEINNLNLDLENERMFVEQIQQEADCLAEQKEQLKIDKESLMQEMQQIQEQLDQQTLLVGQLTEQSNRKEEDILQKENQLKELTNKMNESQLVMEELEKNLKEVNERMSQVNEIIQEKDDVLAQKEETIKILKESVENYQIKYDNKRQELLEIHEMISQLQNEIKQKEIQLDETSQLKDQLSLQFQELNMQHDNLIYQNKLNFEQIQQGIADQIEQSQLVDVLSQEKEALSNTLFSNQELIQSYKVKLEELQEAFEYKNITISEQEKQILELNHAISSFDQLCQQQSLEILNYKQQEQQVSTNFLVDKEEYDKKERELREKIENLSIEIQELNRQNDEQTNEFANKIIILESSNSELIDQMEQIKNDKDRQIQLVKEKYLQLENEYRGQIEDLQSQLKWDQQMHEDSEKRNDDNIEFSDERDGNYHLNSNENNQSNLDMNSKQDLDSHKERIDHLEVEIIKLKNELQTSHNTNTVIERQIKSLHSQNENLAKEIDSLLQKLDQETKKSLALQKESDEQIESITNEKREIKMNFDELLERMNDSESFEKLNQMQKQIDQLKLEKEQHESKQPRQLQQLQQLQTPSKQIPFKKNGSEDLEEINLQEPNSDQHKSPSIVPADVQQQQQQSQQSASMTQLYENKKTGGFFNTLAGIFLTEKDRKMIELQKQ